MRLGPLVIAVVLAVVCGFIALTVVGGKEEPAPQVVAQQPQVVVKEVETVNVLIASQFVPIGTVISEQHVSSQPWPKNLISPSFMVDTGDMAQIVGKISRSSFQEGEPFAATKLASADEGSFLAGSLPKGMRAVTINTDETLGVAGFVFPGDKVDVLITHRVPKWDQLRDSADMQDITETLLSNVTVMAVDQIANAQEIAANSQQQQNQQQQGAGTSTIHIPRTVSLMVDPVSAQKLRLGEKVGQLSLTLRSAEDRETIDMATLLKLQNITQFPLDSVVAPEKKAGGEAEDGIRVIRGTAAENVAPIEPQKKSLPVVNNPLQVMSSAVPVQTAAVSSSAPASATVAQPAPAPSQPATVPVAADISPALPVVTIPSVQTVPASTTQQ